MTVGFVKRLRQVGFLQVPTAVRLGRESGEVVVHGRRHHPAPAGCPGPELLGRALACLWGRAVWWLAIVGGARERSWRALPTLEPTLEPALLGNLWWLLRAIRPNGPVVIAVERLLLLLLARPRTTSALRGPVDILDGLSRRR